MTNRITPYEAGWLQMLLDRGMAGEAELREAQRRVAQEAVRELEERRRRRAAKKRKRRDNE